MLARVEGKSRVDYLSDDWHADFLREFCYSLLTGDMPQMTDAFDLLEGSLKSY